MRTLKIFFSLFSIFAASHAHAQSLSNGSKIICQQYGMKIGETERELKDQKKIVSVFTGSELKSTFVDVPDRKVAFDRIPFLKHEDSGTGNNRIIATHFFRKNVDYIKTEHLMVMKISNGRYSMMIRTIPHSGYTIESYSECFDFKSN